MSSPLRSFLAAWRFLTIFPPKTASMDESHFESAPAWFPLVGLLLGVLCGGACCLADGCFPATVSSALVIILLWVVSGGLHADGLADTADGFLSSRPKDRILEIMRDPRSGPMAVMALICVFAVKWAALANILSMRHRLIALALAPSLGRCNSLFMMNHLSYARAQGLASGFASTKHWLALSVAYAALAMSGFYFWNGAGLALVGSSLIFGVVFSRYSAAKIGGYTGDTLGAVCELTEAVVLLVACLADHVGSPR